MDKYCIRQSWKYNDDKKLIEIYKFRLEKRTNIEENIHCSTPFFVFSQCLIDMLEELKSYGFLKE